MYASKKKVKEVISVVDDSPDVKKKKPGPVPKKTKATDKPHAKDITKKNQLGPLSRKLPLRRPPLV